MSQCPKCYSTETYQKQSGPHTGEYCVICDAWIRWLPQGLEKFVWPIGQKHKGKLILDIAKHDRPYLEWAADNLSSPKLKEKAREALRFNLPVAESDYSLPGQPAQAKPPRRSQGVRREDLETLESLIAAIDPELPPW